MDLAGGIAFTGVAVEGCSAIKFVGVIGIAVAIAAGVEVESSIGVSVISPTAGEDVGCESPS